MSRPTQDTVIKKGDLAYWAITIHGVAFQRLLPSPILDFTRSYNPASASTPAVWATPRSLAATGGITVVFFSCG